METAVVILNWNGVAFLKQFLPTLIQFTPEAKTIVIDNQSTDESTLYLHENHPEVEVIINSFNGGFAKGYNDGLNLLNGRFKYYVLINSDVEVTSGWLSPLITLMDSNDSIVGVQPKILSYKQKDTFEYAGACGGYMDKNYYPFCRGRMFDVVEKDTGQYDSETEVFWVSGACMAVRANIFHSLKGFDEDFFAHMEEIDFCWRAKRQGYTFYVNPASVIYHVGGGTLAYGSPRKTYLNFRNSLYMIHKNHKRLLFFKVCYRLCLDGLAGIKFLLSGQFHHIIAILKAHFHYYRDLGKLQRKRKALVITTKSYNKSGLFKGSLLWNYYFKKIRIFSRLNQRLFSER
ncbi:MAG: glycosyltransferase family 2 protein [Brumimicrobium sp.]|nr:glycosyltransferase family 2 protein [Brumimicrobium sp.]